MRLPLIAVFAPRVPLRAGLIVSADTGHSVSIADLIPLAAARRPLVGFPAFSPSL